MLVIICIGGKLGFICFGKVKMLVWLCLWNDEDIILVIRIIRVFWLIEMSYSVFFVVFIYFELFEFFCLIYWRWLIFLRVIKNNI